LWEAVATTFYDGYDEPQIFTLNWQVSYMNQGGRAIKEYYDDLQKAMARNRFLMSQSEGM
jgi:hypothetical protein